MITTQEPRTDLLTQIDHPNIKQSIGGNLCLVKMTIRAPDGRYVLKDYRVEALQKDGQYAQVKEGSITHPRLRIDAHPLWRKLAENKTQIINLRNRYTVNDAIEGQYLMNMTKLGDFLHQFIKLRDKRLQLARLMQDLWHTEVIESIIETVGQDNFDLHIKHRLPNPDTLPARFDVEYALYPLTPVSGGDLTFESMDAHQAQQIIDEVNEKARQTVLDRFQKVADCVLGETLQLCQDIEDGSLETGKKKGKSLEKILDTLDRVRNFKEWATPEVLQHVDHVYHVVKNTTHSDVNKSKEVQQAIKSAFEPLGKAVKILQGKRHRLKRQLIV